MYLSLLVLLGTLAFNNAIETKEFILNDEGSMDEYSAFLKAWACKQFHPEMTDPIDISNLDAASLDEMLVDYAAGRVQQVCANKAMMRELREKGIPEDRIVFTATGIALASLGVAGAQLVTSWWQG
jgi:hypothetical protein